MFLRQISELKKEVANLKERPVTKIIQLKVRNIQKQIVFPHIFASFLCSGVIIAVLENPLERKLKCTSIQCDRVRGASEILSNSTSNDQ